MSSQWPLLCWAEYLSGWTLSSLWPPDADGRDEGTEQTFRVCGMEAQGWQHVGKGDESWSPDSFQDVGSLVRWEPRDDSLQFPHLQVRKLRLGEVKGPAQGHLDFKRLVRGNQIFQSPGFCYCILCLRNQKILWGSLPPPILLLKIDFLRKALCSGQNSYTC